MSVALNPGLQSLLSSVAKEKAEGKFGAVDFKGIDDVDVEGDYYRVKFSIVVGGLLTFSPTIRIKQDAVHKMMGKGRNQLSGTTQPVEQSRFLLPEISVVRKR